MDIISAGLSALVAVLMVSIIWGIFHKINKRLTRIDKELRAITVKLDEMPNEASLQEYVFSQDQRLRGIKEKLDTSPSTDMLQQCIQDQANQVIAFLSTHSEGDKSTVSKKEIETLLQTTDELIKRVLWSLRFDEDKYMTRDEPRISYPDNQKNKTVSKLNVPQQVSKALSDKVSMEEILDGCDDEYDAMLKYMQQSGKSGVEAQHALKAAKTMRGIA